MTVIYANYEVCSTWDLDEVCENLDIKRSQIKEYYVKWDQLVLTYIDDDGEEVEEEIAPGFSASEEFNWKHPTTVVEE